MVENKSLRISIVIPVYNEEDQLAACLEAIAGQTVKPHEVIVVDNNSTDNSVAIAERFTFVRLLSESRQGVVYARDRGFDVASGDVIGRIDADSIIASDWVESVQAVFADGQVGVATGKMKYHDIALARVVDAIDLRIRRHLARLLGREVAVQGSNMAVRRSTWRAIRKQVCRKRGLHEDFDLAIHANWNDWLVVFDERMVAKMGYRQANSNFRDFSKYVLLSTKTYALHGLKSRRHMYPIVLFVLACYLPIKLVCKGYDPETGKLSLHRLLYAKPAVRVNPATYVD